MKLGFADGAVEIPQNKTVEKITLEDLDDKKFIKEFCEANGPCDEATAKLYLQNVCP